MDGGLTEIVVNGSTVPLAMEAVDSHPLSDAENIDSQYERRLLSPEVNMYGLSGPPETIGSKQ